MTDSLIRNEEPLGRSYVPEDLVDRTDEAEAIKHVMPGDSTGTAQNLHVQGPRGSGKSVLIQHALANLPDTVQRYVVPCTEFDTQYKVLRALHGELTGEPNNSGHHAATFQRTIEDRLGTVPAVLVLDDGEFLLENDGDDLLYFLSRLDNSDSVSVVLTSSHTTELQSELEDRTYSSLYPQRLPLDPYESETVYSILRDRAENALRARSIHREALTYISASISNVAFGRHWLRQAASSTDSVISEEIVRTCYEQAYDSYVSDTLSDFSEHHRVLYRIVETEAADESITSGSVYDAYQKRCSNESVDPLSTRRVSDFLTHLELIGLIDVDYHYGGRNGRTREIRLHRLV